MNARLIDAALAEETPVVDYVRQLEEAHRAVASINAILKTLNPILDLEELERTARRLIRGHLRFDRFALLIYDSSRRQFVFSAAQGIEQATAEALRAAAEESAADWLSKPGDAVVLEAVPRTRKTERYALVSLDTHGTTLGVIVLPANEARTPSPEELAVLTLIASGILCAYHNARIYSMTRKLVVWDVKTDLYNHRYFLRALSNEICRARRYGRQLSLLLLDVDNFKRYNDRYGHLAGDWALAEVAKVIKQNIRVVDIAARFGGDEFFVLLPETGSEGANVVAARLRAAVAERNFDPDRRSRRKTPVRLTVSCGAATLGDTMTARELMELADQAMLAEKRSRARHSRPRRS